MLEIQSKIGAGGRVIIPAPLREALNLSIGDDIFLHLEDGEIHITTPQQALRKIRERLTQSEHKNHSLVDELIAERRKENSHE